MNEILQQRIEKAARHYLLNEHRSPLNEILHQCDLKTEMQYHKDIENAYIAGATFALQNQWISVDEALPEDYEDVFVRNEFGKCTSAWHAKSGWHLCYGEIAGDDLIDSKITHWMTIPSLEGGEK